MTLNHFKYLSVLSLPVMVFLSLMLGGIYSYAALIFLFGFIPLAELLFKGSSVNMDEIEEAVAKDDRVYDYLLYALFSIQFSLLIYFLACVSDSSMPLYEMIGMVTAFGMACGQSINNAHELGHRQKGYEQVMSKLLLMSSLYMHFFIEHNRGHHKHVATEEDPASSRYGEHIYAFYYRSIKNSWLSAWQIEHKRLRRAGASLWSLHNEMLVYQLIQFTFLLIIYLFFGLTALMCFIGSAVIGILLLETVNYIEHYGLRRKKNDKGYERTMPVHSWNSNHPLGRLILLELSRHSDHHFVSNRPYQILRHFDESPQMPTGYPGMMLLAMLPPLWFRVMHKQLVEYRQTQMGQFLA